MPLVRMTRVYVLETYRHIVDPGVADSPGPCCESFFNRSPSFRTQPRQIHQARLRRSKGMPCLSLWDYVRWLTCEHSGSVCLSHVHHSHLDSSSGVRNSDSIPVAKYEAVREFALLDTGGRLQQCLLGGIHLSRRVKVIGTNSWSAKYYHSDIV